MADLSCSQCGTSYDAGLSRCPNCKAPHNESDSESIKETTQAAKLDSEASKKQTTEENAAEAQKMEQYIKGGGSSIQQKKGHGCRNFILIAIGAIILLVAVSFCTSGPASLDSVKGTEWGSALNTALSETDIERITEVRSRVTLEETDDEGKHKDVNNPGSLKDFSEEELLHRDVWLETESGRRIQASYYDNARLYKLSDDNDYKTVYWALPDADGDYVEDVVSFKTGEIVHPKNEEKAAEAEARYQEYVQRTSTTNDVTEALEAAGLTHEQAWDAYNVLGSVGVGGLGNVTQLTDNPPLKVMTGIINGHQVNFTLEDGRVFYIQITGFAGTSYDWYINWRGKLRYGIVDEILSFDLYDSTAVEGGHIAYYNTTDNSVIPWDEH